MDVIPKTIAVFGASEPTADSQPYLLAYQLGQALGAGGYNIVNGGYKGTMAASARGVRDAGGLSTGVTCDAFGPSGPNPWIDKEIRTKDLTQRLNTLIRLADAYIILPGSTGTLLELVTCWELMNKKFLSDAPLICLGAFWKPVYETIIKTRQTDGHQFHFVDSLDDVVSILNEFFADKM